MVRLEREVETTDPPVGFTWGESDGNRYLTSPDNGLRRISDDGWKLLTALAEGEVSKEELEGTPRKIVEDLEREGYLRPDEPVVKLRKPDGIRLWPRLVAFLCLVAVGAVVAWRETQTMPNVVELLTPARIVPFLGLVVVTLAIHEGGHYFTSKPYFDPSVRVGLVNGAIPAAITDTTEAWVLPRNHRLWITLAGPFVQIVWTLLVAGVHLVFFPDSVVLSAFVIMTVAETVVVLNPLIHGDGYLLLIDAFDVVDLRTQGIEHLRNRNLTFAAVYVVVSYGFGAVMGLVILGSVASFLGADVPLV
ncbi:hypothetical protein [Halorussus lipolyticus]|uniref:hypothetical protein n=1 Tax=Halorussus lipolyticus TaxID=3034024 RepID=UPI0023E8914A|nr:hypothetical protein [Halorussus sp. DT80]